MSVALFLKNYWSYITTGGLAFWTVFLYQKNQKLERKKAIEPIYVQLIGIISSFQSHSVKIFDTGGELLEIKLQIFAHEKKINSLLGQVKNTKRDELLDLTRNIDGISSGLIAEINATTDDYDKAAKRREIDTLLQQIKRLREDFKEEKANNEPKLYEANEILEKAHEALGLLSKRKERSIILLSNSLDTFIYDLQNSPSARLAASKTVINIIDNLERCSLRLRHFLLDIASSDHDAFLMEVVKSLEFKEVWELCLTAINQMRVEVQ